MSGLDSLFSMGSAGSFDMGSAGDFLPTSNLVGDLGWMNSMSTPSLPLPESVTGLDWMGDMRTPNFLDNLWENAKSNPLGAVATALGAYGAYKDSKATVPPGTLNAVEQLMMKGDLLNKYTPQPVSYKQPVAKDPRRYMQSYDLNGNATSNSMNAGTVSDTYKSVLGRAPDVGGAAFWENNMNNLGMQGHQLERALWSSPEAQVNRQFQGVLGRRPEFEALNYWNAELSRDPNRQDALRESLLAGPENAVNSLYREELGRDPDREGQDYWMRMMNTKGMGPEDVRLALRASPEYKAKPAPTTAAPVAGIAAGAPAPGSDPTGFYRPGKLGGLSVYNEEFK